MLTFGRVNKYGEVALRATELLRAAAYKSAREAWQAAAREVFPAQRASQMKACPRSAFLGLCEEGLVVGVPAGRYTTGGDNKEYAIEAVQLLVRDSSLAEAGPGSLWLRVMNSRDKVANSQMEVVLALWAHGLIDGNRLPPQK